MNNFQYISKLLNEAQFMDLSVVNDLPTKLNSRELARAIRMAIAAEHEAVDLYETISDACENLKIKRIIQDISDEEKVHVGELERLLIIVDPDDLTKRIEGKKEVEQEKGD